MGGLVIVLKGEDVAEALVAFAREYGITHIVVGRPGKKRPWQVFKRSLHDVLLEELPHVDFIIA
jgi:two-component system sensor histidine kinase KdpD